MQVKKLTIQDRLKETITFSNLPKFFMIMGNTGYGKTYQVNKIINSIITNDCQNKCKIIKFNHHNFNNEQINDLSKIFNLIVNKQKNNKQYLIVIDSFNDVYLANKFDTRLYNFINVIDKLIDLHFRNVKFIFTCMTKFNSSEIINIPDNDYQQLINKMIDKTKIINRMNVNFLHKNKIRTDN